jgi:prephenate dehydratase
MIPIENSIAGRVADIHHLLPTRACTSSASIFLPIHFQLMAPKGATLDTIKTVAQPHPCARPVPQDHPQARLEADRRRRHRRLRARGRRGRRPPARRSRRGSRPRSTASTSSPKRRGRRAQHHALRHPVEDAGLGRARQRPVMTTFVFRVRNVPAALYKALGGFATNGVNMTKLESYMLDGRFFATSSTPTSTATPTTARSSWRWRNSRSSGSCGGRPKPGRGRRS